MSLLTTRTRWNSLTRLSDARPTLDGARDADRAGEVGEAACAGCGCTENAACWPTCWWVAGYDDDVCSRCAAITARVARHAGAYRQGPRPVSAPPHIEALVAAAAAIDWSALGDSATSVVIAYGLQPLLALDLVELDTTL